MERDEILPPDTYLAPRSDLEAALVAIWQDVLNIGPIGVNDSFFDLVGRNTLIAIQLTQRLLLETGRELPLVSLFSACTVAEQARLLETRDPVQPWSPVVAFHPRATSAPFYCAPGIAGDLFVLANLAEITGTEVNFHGLVYPGLDGSSAPVPSIVELASDLVRGIRAVQPDGPYFLGGYSFGGMVAFEMAQQLLAEGVQVERLILIDSFAQHPRLRHILSLLTATATKLRRQPDAVERFFVAFRDTYYRGLHFLRTGLGEHIANGGTSLVGKYVRRVRLRDRVQRRAQENRLEGAWDRFRMDPTRARLTEVNDRAFRLYVPNTYPGPIVLIRSEHGQGHASMRPDDPTLGWHAVAGGDLQLHWIPSDHMNMLRKPAIELVAGLLRRLLR